MAGTLGGRERGRQKHENQPCMCSPIHNTPFQVHSFIRTRFLLVVFVVEAITFFEDFGHQLV
jgi:hypothetical protein